MLRNKCVSATLALCFAAGPALSDDTMKSRATTVDRVILTATSYPMPPCPPKITISRIVRAVIPVGYDPGVAHKRNVRHTIKVQDNDPKDNKDNGKTNYWEGISSNNEPFHIDITQIDSQQGEYAEIRIVLRAIKKYRFFDNNGIKGVAYADQNNVLGMCGARLENSGMFPKAVFYVKMNGDTGGLIYGAYNIGLVPFANPTTEIWVDPKVKNDG